MDVPRKDVSLTSLLKEEIEKIPKGEKEGRRLVFRRVEDAL